MLAQSCFSLLVLGVAIHQETRQAQDFRAYRPSAIPVAVRQELRQHLAVEQSTQPTHYIHAELRILSSLWVIHAHWALIVSRPLSRAHGGLAQDDQSALT